jgi:hypothetical protein
MSPRFSPSTSDEWIPLTPPRLFIDKETGEVQVRAGFRNRYTGKIKTFWREASIEEIQSGEIRGSAGAP